MSISGRCLRVSKRIVFGESLLPQEFTIGLEDPHAEIAVWLHTPDDFCDVTGRQTTACTAPLKLCIGFHDGQRVSEHSLDRAVLKFCARDTQRQVLGEIRLRFDRAISIGTSQFILFGVRGSANYCLPGLQLWAHYLLNAYLQWRRNDPPDIRMTLVEQRAAAVTFIRPHPLCLVSVGDWASGNLFTMNLMGDLGNGYFGFALRDRRVVADLVERAGRIAISGIPLTQCRLAFQFAANYKKESIDWAGLPFETALSTEFGIPVPNLATTVRELEVVKVHRIGSHRLFIARIFRDEAHARGLRACVVHGFYQYWRTKGDSVKLRASVVEDSAHKRGF
jgi:flavin reductase (DIM6/NTAB) family NADH-FMN oxidoreductase RutF